MTDQRPITPLPKKLLSEWDKTWHSIVIPTDPRTYLEYMYDQCAQWGADQELEACCEWLDERAVLNGSTALRAARRPKPPTLNSIALQMLGTIERDAHYLPEITDTIRRALEQLPND